MEHPELHILNPTLEVYAQETLGYPTMPVGIYLNESETIANHIDDDSARFSILNITAQELSAEIRNATAALRSAEILWNRARASRSTDQKTWSDNEHLSYELRDSSLDRLDFFFEIQGNEDGLRAVDEIRKGSGHGDMLLDLAKISEILDEHRDMLEQSIGFSLMEQAEIHEMYVLLTHAYGSATAARQDAHEERLLRDRAFAHVEMLIGRVKKAVKIIWRGNSEEQRKYRSEYRRREYLRSLKPKEVSAV